MITDCPRNDRNGGDNGIIILYSENIAVREVDSRALNSLNSLNMWSNMEIITLVSV
jgi:hypothetical protein